MGDVSVPVWLGCGYAAFLVMVAHGLDLMAKRASYKAARWQSGSFRYHEDHDAWVCPQDQWLWPHSFDPDNRVVRYRASPTVCNSCPVKHTCTTSDTGREISRNVDPWPHSEAGRFHRGIACSATVLAVLLPLVLMVGRSALESGVLALASSLAAAASWPLWQHLRGARVGLPEHLGVPSIRGGGPRSAMSPAPPDRYSTRWGSVSYTAKATDQQPGEGRIRQP
jgi:hypothetical protein